MRMWLVLFLLMAALPATAAIPPGQWLDLPKDFPEKALDFMERRASCNLIGGNMGIAPRDKEFADVKAKLRCRFLDTEEKALKRTYADNPSVLRFLDISRNWDLRNEPPFFRKAQP